MLINPTQPTNQPTWRLEFVSDSCNLPLLTIVLLRLYSTSVILISRNVIYTVCVLSFRNISRCHPRWPRKRCRLLMRFSQRLRTRCSFDAAVISHRRFSVIKRYNLTERRRCTADGRVTTGLAIINCRVYDSCQLQGWRPLKRQTSASYGCVCMLGLRPRLNVGPVCDAQRREATYAACGAI